MRRNLPVNGASLIAKDPLDVLNPHLVGDARFRQAHRFGERCMGPARAARQIAASAAPIDGANSKGIRRTWRSFQAEIRHSASAIT
jgi:hypothetical protein